MYQCRGTLTAENHPPVGVNSPSAVRGTFSCIVSRVGVVEFSFSDATSKDISPPAVFSQSVVADDCARSNGALAIPNMTGPATATIPSAEIRAFLMGLRFAIRRFAMTLTTRRLRSEPEIPDIQAMGDSTYDLQTARIVSA